MWEIYAYWNTGMLSSVFNALASLSVNNSYLNLLVVVALLGFLAALGVAMARVRGEEPVLWMFFMAFFYGVLLVPKTSVTIIDRTSSTGAPIIVNNVPLGIAAFAGTTSKIGDWLTRQYETLFSVPDELQYANGMVFGAKLMKAATSAIPLDPEFTRDLYAYMQDCVGPDIVSGHKSLEAILKTEDLWSEMGGTNPARLVWIGGSAQSCPDAYVSLGARITTATQQTHSHLARLLNSTSAASGVNQTALNALLGSQLPVAADVLLRVSSATSLDYVRQAMLVNLWREFPAASAAMTDSPTAAQLAISEAQAQAASRSSYATMAAIAEEALPKVRNAFQVIIIMVFPIVMLLIIAAGHKGGAIFKHYVLALLWVEMWPVIYAAVSWIMQTSSEGTAMGLLGGLAAPPASTGLSIMNSEFIVDEMLRTEHIAGMITLMVIPISAALLWGGTFAMTSVASSVMAPASSAAQSSGAQAGMGKFDGGSITYDMVRTNINSANQWKTRAEMAPGPTPGQAGGTDYTDPGKSTYTAAAATITSDRGRVAAVTPTGGSGTVTAQGGIARSQVSSDGREVSSLVREAASEIQSIGTRLTEGQRAQVAEALGQSIREGIAKRYGGESGSGTSRTIDAGEGRKGAGSTGHEKVERDTMGFNAGVNVGLPARGGGAGGASTPAAPGGAASPGLIGGLLSLIKPSAGGNVGHEDIDGFKQALQSLASQDAGKRRQAQEQIGALTQVMREIAANPREERAVREVARDVAQTLERAVQASRQTETSVSDTTKAGVSSNQTMTGSFGVSASSPTAYFQTLAAAMGLDPNRPDHLQAAAAFNNANPQVAQALIAQATRADQQVLAQGGAGPQLTPDELKTQGQGAVASAHTGNTAAIEAANKEFQAAQSHAAKTMTGLNPTPDGKIAVQGLHDRLDKERTALEGKAGEDARLARIVHGATAAAAALVQNEMRKNGEDFSHIDPNRVARVRDQILGAALGGPGGGGNERLAGELLMLSDFSKPHDRLNQNRLDFIQRNSGIRWSEDGKQLEWGTRPETKPAKQDPYAHKRG